MNAKAKAKALPPERTLHRGSVLAAGVIVDPELTSEDEAKRRVFELALRGADVRRHGTRYVVCFHAPVRLLAHEAPGQVFTRAGELLLTAPLSEREIAAAVARGVREPTLVCVEGGSVVVTPLSALARDDLAAWLDLEPFQVVETTSLGDANVAPTRALAPVESNVRGVAGVGEMSAETASVLDWLKKPARDASTSNEASAARQRAPGAPSKFWQALTSALGAAWAAFGREPLGSGAGTRGAGPADSNAYDPRAERGPSAWTRLRAAMNAFAAKFLDMTRLSSLIMGKHAEYLSRMMNMFEENDLDEALRHAIPLSKEVEGALRMHMLRPPSARTQLAITHAASQTTAALSLGDDLFSLLRAKYRRAFEQLVARGEIDKAAFVLAELLNEDEEAVAFLEKHRLWKRAAELAEARRLAPAIVVRQWFLAGDRARAIRIARATGAFADAVVRLERSHPQEAQALRILWANALADAGAYAAAVDAAWPVPEARALAKSWLDRAIEVGGATGARMLVRKLRLVPESFEEVRDRMITLAAETSDGPWVEVMGYALVDDPPLSPELRAMAKWAARTLLAVGTPPAGADALASLLVSAADDPLFAADMKAPTPQLDGHMHIDAYARTDTGAVREHNEDRCLAAFLVNGHSSLDETMAISGNAVRRGVVLGAFDGVGGRSSGEQASIRVAETLLTTLRKRFDVSKNADGERWAKALADAVVAGNRALWDLAQTTATMRGAGCAATVATIAGSTLLVAQVGDTRGYVLRDGKLVQVTEDHSLLNEYIKLKRLTPEEIENFPHKNVIIRAMGMKDSVRPDVWSVALRRDDVILLCSDGIHGVVSEAAIRAALAHPPQHACRELRDAAYAAGAPDNLSIAVAHVGGRSLALSEGTPVEALLVGESGAARSTTLVTIRRDVADVGAIAVHDAAELADGRLLVALGELGVRVYSRTGKVLTQLVEPCDYIVLSAHGDRAIFVARRGDSARLTRFDALSNRARPWCDAHIGAFARTFDGATWFVGAVDEATFYEIDATHEGWKHDGATLLARSAAIDHVAWSPGHLNVVVRQQESTMRTPFTFELFCYQSPGTTLRARENLSEGVDPERSSVAVSARGHAAGWCRWVEESVTKAFVRFDNQWMEIPVVPTLPLPQPVVSDAWCVFGEEETRAPGEHTTRLRVFAMGTRTASLVVELPAKLPATPGARRLLLERTGIRLQDDRAIVFDLHGRVLVIALDERTVVRELRVS